MAQPEHPLPTDFFIELDRTSPVPLYFQISSRLERAISENELPPGSRLENEVSLGQRYGFSRPTVRRAIQVLVDKGLLVRRRGVGTQVVHGQVKRNVELTSLYEDLDGSGQKPSTVVTVHELVAADAVVAERLGLTGGAEVLHVVRVRSADGVPLAVLENWLPVELGELDRGELETFGLYQLLRARGVSMRVAQQRIGARSATAAESEQLGLGRGAALLTMERTAFDQSGRAVEFGRHCYSPDLYSFEITLVDR